MALATKWVVTFNAGVLCEKAAKRSLQRSFAVLLSPSLSPSLARLICIHVNTNTPLSCIYSAGDTPRAAAAVAEKRSRVKIGERWHTQEREKERVAALPLGGRVGGSLSWCVSACVLKY